MIQFQGPPGPIGPAGIPGHDGRPGVQGESGTIGQAVSDKLFSLSRTVFNFIICVTKIML